MTFMGFLVKKELDRDLGSLVLEYIRVRVRA